MKYIFYVILMLSSFSCTRETKKPISNKSSYTSYTGTEASWDLYFPDTVDLNQKYRGKIIYKGILDSITTSFDDKYERYIKVVLMTSDKLNIEFDEIRKFAKDTFGAINHREIHFDNIMFKTPGKNYIHGYIIDHIFLDAIGTKPEDSLVRFIEKEIKVDCKVYVRK